MSLFSLLFTFSFSYEIDQTTDMVHVPANKEFWTMISNNMGPLLGAPEAPELRF